MTSPFIELEPESAARWFSWWQWATGEGSPVALTKFSDWIFERADGSLHHLSIQDGSTEPICGTRNALSRALADPEAADRYLCATFTERAERAGLRLKEGECYSWIVPPVLGGSYDQENVRPFAIGGYQLVMTQVAQLARHVPEGTEVERIRMKFRADGSLDLLIDGRSLRG